MKKTFITLLAFLMAILTLTLTACGDESESYSLPDVTVWSEFEITLNAHGGTAYQWDYEIKPSSGIEYISMEYVPTNNDPDIIGGGTLIYKFKAVKTGNYKIKFELSIPWESEPPIELKTYQIKVIASN